MREELSGGHQQRSEGKDRKADGRRVRQGTLGPRGGRAAAVTQGPLSSPQTDPQISEEACDVE